MPYIIFLQFSPLAVIQSLKEKRGFLQATYSATKISEHNIIVEHSLQRVHSKVKQFKNIHFVRRISHRLICWRPLVKIHTVHKPIVIKDERPKFSLTSLCIKIHHNRMSVFLCIKVRSDDLEERILKATESQKKKVSFTGYNQGRDNVGSHLVFFVVFIHRALSHLFRYQLQLSVQRAPACNAVKTVTQQKVGRKDKSVNTTHLNFYKKAVWC